MKLGFAYNHHFSDILAVKFQSQTINIMMWKGAFDVILSDFHQTHTGIHLVWNVWIFPLREVVGMQIWNFTEVRRRLF